MRRALPAVVLGVLVVLAAGCGGGKKTPQLTKAQYAAALDKLCSSANNQVAALGLTTSMQTWKQNGQKAAKIADQTVKGFEALTPPDSLADSAAKYEKASEDIAAAVRDAADAAKNGDVKKFDDAISRQQNAGTQARTEASDIGAKTCSGG
jgi:hypothetical protein